jgi:DNA-binding LacI/PurR family transcriptional regulator
MPRKKTNGGSNGASAPQQTVSLKTLADYLGLSPATISLVINRSPAADSIPTQTQQRIFAAAKKFHYRPNFAARALRTQRSFTIGVVVPEVSEGYAAMVMGGIEDHLLTAGYFYLVASHRHRADLIAEYPKLLLGRSVEGIIAVDTPCGEGLPVPIVTISGSQEMKGLTQIVLNHARAAALALEHLSSLGHRRVAFIKGQEFSSDTAIRWGAIRHAAGRLNMPIEPRLVVQLEGDSPSPEPGYVATQKLLSASRSFTAVFAFNDISAIGCIRALREGGLRIPQDVSVVGFDDIQSAAFQNPGLTTVRQPLRKMGEIAAETLLQRIASGEIKSTSRLVTVEPELVVRESTSRSKTQGR